MALMTKERIIQDLAEILGTKPEDINLTQSLTDQGLDSLRLITLVEKWRADGCDVEFYQILTQPTLQDWFIALNAQ